MAVMTTVLTEFSDKDNSRVYTLVGHTTSVSKQLIQTRKVPVGNQVTIEDKVIVSLSTLDAAGAVMPQKCSITITVARPVGHTAADMTSVLAIARDVVAGDEFTNTVTTQEYLI